MLEKFKGELNGEFKAVYLATDTYLNRYKTNSLELKQIGSKIFNDIKKTKWEALSNEEYKSIKKQLLCVMSQNYLANRGRLKHKIKNSSGRKI